MSHLKELTIVEDLNPKTVSPTIKARTRLIAALKEQLKAAGAMVAGEPYMITKMRWETNDDTGERVRVPIQVSLFIFISFMLNIDLSFTRDTQRDKQIRSAKLPQITAIIEVTCLKLMSSHISLCRFCVFLRLRRHYT